MGIPVRAIAAIVSLAYVPALAGEGGRESFQYVSQGPIVAQQVVRNTGQRELA